MVKASGLCSYSSHDPCRSNKCGRRRLYRSTGDACDMCPVMVARNIFATRSTYMTRVACHTSHLTPHTSHLTHHTSHLTPHTSHLTPHTLCQGTSSRAKASGRCVTRHASRWCAACFTVVCCIKCYACDMALQMFWPLPWVSREDAGAAGSARPKSRGGQ